MIGTAEVEDDETFEEFNPEGGGGFVPALSRYSDVYAFRIRGHKLHRTIKDGEFVVASPTAPLMPGERAVIGLRSGRKMVKDFVFERSDAYTVASVRTGEQMSVDRGDVEFIHAVVGIASPSQLIVSTDDKLP